MIDSPFNLALMTLISEDLAFFLGLVGVQKETFSATNFIIFYAMGVLVGDLMLYGVGFLSRYIKWVDRLKWLSSLRSDPSKIKNKTYGKFEDFLVLTRFIPGSRIPTYTYCGFSGYPVSLFCLILLISTIIYAVTGVLLIQFAKNYILIENPSLFDQILMAMGVSLLTITFFRLVTLCYQLKKKYNAVLKPLKLFLLRLRYLEFWPIWIFYAPLVPYFLFLLIRYRGFGGVLVSNPSLRTSGLVGELKSEIDGLIKENVQASHLKSLTLKSFDLKESRQKINDYNLDFPLIIKPDSGMRGLGVKLLSNDNDLKHYLDDAKKASIIQEYCPHRNEWGVYYYRFPGQEKGHIFSITIKEFPIVLGDGERTLFDLVLNEKYFKYRFNWIFNDFDGDPLSVPAKAEKVQLVFRGSHSKGCLFKDGQAFMQSPQAECLKAALDKMPEFYIGRADIRFENLQELAKGHFKIIEINGAGGESSNFYDPDLSIINVYKTMMNQWSLLFKIGNMNVKRGIGPGSLVNFLKIAFNYKRGRA